MSKYTPHSLAAQPRAAPRARAPTASASTIEQALQEHTGLIHAVIRRHGSGVLTYEEALQAGRIGLWRALLRYDPTLGAAFSTYAWVVIRRAIWRAARQAAGDQRCQTGPGFPYPLRHEAADPTADVVTLVEQGELQKALRDLVQQLPPRQRWATTPGPCRGCGALRSGRSTATHPTAGRRAVALLSRMGAPVRVGRPHGKALALWPGCAIPPTRLCFPRDPTLPPSPKPSYRSHYRYLGPDGLADPQTLAAYSNFDIAVRLFDYANLERLLAAHIYQPSAKGQIPFHPVSMYLLRVYRREQGYSRHKVLRRLRHRKGGNCDGAWASTPCAPVRRGYATSRSRSHPRYNGRSMLCRWTCCTRPACCPPDPRPSNK